MRTQPLVARIGELYQLMPQQDVEDDLARLLAYREEFIVVSLVAYCRLVMCGCELYVFG
jgi:hypothetical protein